MTTSQLTELKQFFTTALAPISIRLDNVEQGLVDLRNEMHDEIGTLRKEMNDGFAGVGEAVDYIHVQSDKRDLLITRLNNKWRKGQS